MNKPGRKKTAAKSKETPQSAQSSQQQRFQSVLSGLQENGSVAVDDLSAQLGVSVVTIRRDLDLLEQQGLLRRTHGGAISIEPLFYEPFKKDRSFQAQVGRLADEKRRIGSDTGLLPVHDRTRDIHGTAAIVAGYHRRHALHQVGLVTAALGAVQIVE